MKPVILVVDDDPVSRKLAAISLRGLNYEIIEACDPDEALKLAQDRRPAVVLLDLRLPKMGGLELAQRIREAPGGEAVRIAIVTASVMPEERERALAAGCDLFLSKPIDTRELPKLVRELATTGG
jgi:two-component system cell cycle response regulator DivK